MTEDWHVMDPVALAASRWPESPAIISPDGVITFLELDHWVSGTAVTLESSTSSVRVGFIPRDDWRSVVLILALIRAGFTACLISKRFPKAAVHQAAQSVGAMSVLTEWSEIEALVRKGPQCRRAFSLYSPAIVIHTTGSTGQPKPALLSTGNLLYSAVGANMATPLCPRQRWLHTLPLFHVGGLGVIFRCLISGATLVMPGQGESLRAQLRRYRCTHVSLVGTQLLRLLRSSEEPAPSAIKSVIVGGSSVAVSMLREARVLGYPVSTTYGLTEMGSQVTVLPPDSPLDILSSAGTVLPHRKLRIGEGNEIQVKGHTLFKGYVDKDGIHLPVDSDGWFSTGDCGSRDENGLLYVEGRKDNIFFSGGENIVPEEIERVLGDIEGVRRAVVVPVPDAEFGERPVAFIDGTDQFDRLKSEVEMRLPGFKTPVLKFWPGEEENLGLKIDREQLKRLAQL